MNNGKYMTLLSIAAEKNRGFYNGKRNGNGEPSEVK